MAAQPLVRAVAQAVPAPVGYDYVLKIEAARSVDLRKLGPSIEVKLTVAVGPNIGGVARGQFPLTGRGLSVLIEAALGEQLDLSDPAAVLRLVGKSVLADVVHTGNPTDRLAIVRNIRAVPAAIRHG